MAPSSGDLYILKVGDGGDPETFLTVGGLRPTSMTINGAPVDVSSKDSNGWRRLLAGGGMKSLDISAGGVYLGNGSSHHRSLKELARKATLRSFQLDDGVDVIEAEFQVVTFEHGGDAGAEQTFSISLQSSGGAEPTITLGS
jgi:TP901-1 family phage major tail protein